MFNIEGNTLFKTEPIFCLCIKRNKLKKFKNVEKFFVLVCMLK